MRAGAEGRRCGSVAPRSADVSGQGNWRRQLLVAIVAVVAALSGLLFGYGTAVIAGALPPIAAHFGLNPLKQGLVVAVALLAAGVSAPASGWFTERFGRRTALLLIAVVYAAGSALAATASAYAVLVVGRLVTGMAIGAASFIAPVFIAEISPDRFRGILVTINQLMITLGILAAMLVTYSLSASGQWRAMLGLGLPPAAVLGFGMLLLPESPRWLADHGKAELARRAGERLGVRIEVREEPTTELPAGPPTRRALVEVFHPAHRRVLVTGLVISAAIHFTGLNVAIYYVPSILENSGFGASTATLGGVWVAAVNVMMTVVAMFIVDRLGRRPLFIGGLLIMAVTLAGLGASYATGLDRSVWPTVLLALFIAAAAVGPVAVFWLYVTEIYPQHLRSTALGLVTLAHWSADCLVALTFLPLISATSLATTLWGYAALTLLTALFCMRWMFETSGSALGAVAAPPTGAGSV